MSGAYRTIVADPPWPIHSYGARTPAQNGNWRGKWVRAVAEIPYQTMSVDEIAALPVVDLAADDSHLYLWAINEFLPDAYHVARAWGFRPGSLLTWCKAPNPSPIGKQLRVRTRTGCAVEVSA